MKKVHLKMAALFASGMFVMQVAGCSPFQAILDAIGGVFGGLLPSA